VIPKSAWENGDFSEYTHPRNATAGLINKVSIDPLQMFIQVIFFALNSNPYNSGNNSLEINTVPLLDQPVGFGWTEMNGDCIYTDGTVCETANGLIAYKDQNLLETKDFTVKEISWQVSRLGKLKPVLILEPQMLSDAVISRVTAHNYTTAKAKGLGPGAIVTLRRSGGVIPFILDVPKPVNFVDPENLHEVVGADAYVEVKRDNFDHAMHEVLHAVRPKGTAGEIIGLIRNTLKGSESRMVQGDFDAHEFDLTENAHARVKQMIKDLRGKVWSTQDLIVFSNIPNVGHRSATKSLNDQASDRVHALIHDSETFAWLRENLTHETWVAPIVDVKADSVKVIMTGKVPGMTKAAFAEKHNLVQVGMDQADFIITNDASSSSAKMRKANSLNLTVKTYSSFGDIA
jgi:NAD-dependent DNA ligase